MRTDQQPLVDEGTAAPTLAAPGVTISHNYYFDVPIAGPGKPGGGAAKGGDGAAGTGTQVAVYPGYTLTWCKPVRVAQGNGDHRFFVQPQQNQGTGQPWGGPGGPGGHVTVFRADADPAPTEVPKPDFDSSFDIGSQGESVHINVSYDVKKGDKPQAVWVHYGNPGKPVKNDPNDGKKVNVIVNPC